MIFVKAFTRINFFTTKTTKFPCYYINNTVNVTLFTTKKQYYLKIKHSAHEKIMNSLIVSQLTSHKSVVTFHCSVFTFQISHKTFSLKSSQLSRKCFVLSLIEVSFPCLKFVLIVSLSNTCQLSLSYVFFMSEFPAFYC